MKNSITQLRRKGPTLFALFLLISFLLHLVAALLLQQRQLFPVTQKKPDQTPVAFQERRNWLELDQELKQPSPEPPPESTRLAEANRKVKQESAPRGEDSRDKKAVKSQQPLQAQRQAPLNKPQASPLANQEKNQPRPTPEAAQNGEEPLVATPPKPAPLIDLPKLESLTSLAPTTLARLERQEQKERIKDRPDLELQSDEVWLNLRQMDNKLLSFFRRFHDRIEAVWNYPVDASSRGVEGTLLIKIVVNKKGELLDALPLESSGSDVLDYEAIQAVYRAAPFGALPSSYPHEELKIYAHFQYSLSRRMIYGRP